MNLTGISILKTVILLSFTSSLLAQSNFSAKPKGNQFLRLNIENDMLLVREKTDRYFTSGLKLDYIFSSTSAISPRIAKIFPKVKKGTEYYGLTVSSNMFTPANIKETQMTTNDRPYAGWVYVGLMGIFNNPITNTRFKTEYSVGALGPITQQEKMQMTMHKLIERPMPQGWKYQIANDIALNAFFTAEKRITQQIDYIDIIGLVETNVGTVTNFMGLGGVVRVGWFEDYFKNILPLSTQRRFQTYVFTKPIIRVVADNSLLQGGVFNYHNSPYVIPRDDLYHIHMETAFGYGMSFSNFNLTYSQSFKTAEFKGAKTMFWGTLACAVGF